MKGHGYVTLLAGRLVLSLGTRTCQPVLRGRRAQHHPLLGDSEVGPTLLSGSSLGWSGELGEP